MIVSLKKFSNIFQVESEDMLIRDTYTGGVDGESEGESVDSEGEDSLQLAGVYTVEEVCIEFVGLKCKISTII